MGGIDFCSGFDSNHLSEIRSEYFPVATLVGPGSSLHCGNYLISEGVIACRFDFDVRFEIDGSKAASAPPKSRDSRDTHPSKAMDPSQSIDDGVESVTVNVGFYFIYVMSWSRLECGGNQSVFVGWRNFCHLPQRGMKAGVFAS